MEKCKEPKIVEASENSSGHVLFFAEPGTISCYDVHKVPGVGSVSIQEDEVKVYPIIDLPLASLLANISRVFFKVKAY